MLGFGERDDEVLQTLKGEYFYHNCCCCSYFYNLLPLATGATSTVPTVHYKAILIPLLLPDKLLPMKC